MCALSALASHFFFSHFFNFLSEQKSVTHVQKISIYTACVYGGINFESVAERSQLRARVLHMGVAPASITEYTLNVRQLKGIQHCSQSIQLATCNSFLA